MERRIVDPARAAAILARDGARVTRRETTPDADVAGALVWAGEVRHRSLHPVQYLMLPLAKLTTILKGVYRSVLEFTWGNLLAGRSAPREQRLLANSVLIAAGMFFALALALALALVLRSAFARFGAIGLDVGERVMAYTARRRKPYLVRTDAISDVLLLAHPALMVLVVDAKSRTLRVDDFVTGGEYRYVLLAILERLPRL